MTRIDFGDPHAFAVTVELAEDYNGPWLFGHLCYRIAGRIVGEFDIITSLRDVLGQMHYVVKDAGRRNNPHLFKAPTDVVFHSLRNALYGVDIDPYQKTTELAEFFAVFNGKIPVESFDGWKVFVIDCDEKTRILFGKEGESEIHSTIIDYGIFDENLLKLHGYIGKLLDRES